MPVKLIYRKGRPYGYRWGGSGKLYTIREYGKTGAYEKSRRQGVAVKISQLRHRRPRAHIRIIKVGRGRKRFQRKIINPLIHYPTNIKRPEFTAYKKIAETARKKGYHIPKIDLDKGPVVVDEVNILEDFATDGWLIPDINIKTGDDAYLIFIDDDTTPEQKKKVFAHELGHIHLYEQPGPKKHTENAADKIAADILNIPVKQIKEMPQKPITISKSQWKRFNPFFNRSDGV